jgi:hypothetical protein
MPANRIPSIIILPIGPSIAYVCLTRGMYCIIDSEDISRVDGFSWRAQGREGYWYAKTSVTISPNTERSVSMHRELLNLSKGQLGDHRNRNTLDNRRWNIRAATVAENNRNQKTRITNTSGCTGVSYNKNEGLWWTTITKDRKRTLLGKYSIYEDAVRIRKVAENKEFGEFNPEK